MNGPVFVDTNVFVYLHDDAEPEKKQTRRRLDRAPGEPARPAV